MPKAVHPRHGSMQVWPRVRSKRTKPRIRSWSSLNDAKLLGYPGYKAGMTHITIIDPNPKSKKKNESLTIPSTVLECPPIKIIGATFYSTKDSLTKQVNAFIQSELDKHMKKRLIQSKKDKKLDDIKDNTYDDLRLLVQTQPSMTSIGSKKPEIIEMALGGKKEDKIAYLKENLGKTVTISDTFNAGEVCDIHAITKGKGFQGPVKRFGVSIRHHKSEKTKRGPGSLGGWKGQSGFMYRIAHAGQMGYHQRIQYNNRIIKIGNDIADVNPKGGFVRYGLLKNDYLLLKGSTPGSIKRTIILTKPIRPNRHSKPTEITVEAISTASKQGR